MGNVIILHGSNILNREAIKQLIELTIAPNPEVLVSETNKLAPIGDLKIIKDSAMELEPSFFRDQGKKKAQWKTERQRYQRK
jgi:hypothetical protein